MRSAELEDPWSLRSADKQRVCQTSVSGVDGRDEAISNLPWPVAPITERRQASGEQE